MRNVLGRLLILVVETLERNLVMVPEIDDYDALDHRIPITKLAERNHHD